MMIVGGQDLNLRPTDYESVSEAALTSMDAVNMPSHQR